ncbi:hypothetical protein [Aureliella helgolandensis]|uniref:hypothetical protein n=1 Tax=Aureliella helgolandensis TaxID=2527968 RepID=UPI001E409FC9|nr:hypothetical protein [Aureliella helgolandensis]
MMFALTPGDGSPEVATEFVHALFDAGLMGFVAGGNPTRVRFLPPPGCTTLADIDGAIQIMDQVLAEGTVSW